MPQKSRSRDGFTLIELLIVVAIIGILASMLIPNLIDALNKAKQKKTMTDILEVGTAMMAWLTDNSAAAAAGAGATVDLTDYHPIAQPDLLQTLDPLYMEEIPVHDGWKTSYEYYLNTSNPLAIHVMAMRSNGRNRVPLSGMTYTAGSFETTDFDQDLVWTDGFFVRWPGGGKATN